MVRREPGATCFAPCVILPVGIIIVELVVLYESDICRVLRAFGGGSVHLQLVRLWEGGEIKTDL